MKGEIGGREGRVVRIKVKIWACTIYHGNQHVFLSLVFYGSIVAFSFFVIPYAYFYYEEYEEEGQSKSQRRLSALKYTIFTVSIVGCLFLFGLFLKPNILPPHIDLDWFKHLLTESRTSGMDFMQNTT